MNVLDALNAKLLAVGASTQQSTTKSRVALIFKIDENSESPVGRLDISDSHSFDLAKAKIAEALKYYEKVSGPCYVDTGKTKFMFDQSKRLINVANPITKYSDLFGKPAK
jgi:hypothetical protein